LQNQVHDPFLCRLGTYVINAFRDLVPKGK
jgi:hypothetical protein